LVIDDESCFILQYEHEVPLVGFFSPEFMFKIVWGSAGFYAGDQIICQGDFNKEYFVNEMMQQLADRLFLERRAPHTFWPVMDLTFSAHGFRRVDTVF
jgi:hypothetical protein